MNAIVAHLAGEALLEPARAHAWRGEYLDTFGRAEFVVSEMLVALSATSADPKIGHAHLLGQRLAAMETSLAWMERAGHAAAAAHRTIVALRTHEQLRGLLAHGRSSVKTYPDGRWRMTLRQLVFRHSGTERITKAIDDKEAARLLSELQMIVLALGSQLGQVRRSLRNSAASP